MHLIRTHANLRQWRKQPFSQIMSRGAVALTILVSSHCSAHKRPLFMWIGKSHCFQASVFSSVTCQVRQKFFIFILILSFSLAVKITKQIILSVNRLHKYTEMFHYDYNMAVTSRNWGLSALPFSSLKESRGGPLLAGLAARDRGGGSL